MKLYLIRHAHALPGEVDEVRQLSSKGRRQVRDLAKAPVMEAISAVRAIEHSTLVRAFETAQLLQKYFSSRTPLRKLEGIAPDDSAEATARILVKSSRSRLIIGHNPHLSILVGLLLGLEQGAESIKFRKAGMVAIERLSRPTTKHPFGKWRLLWMVVPSNDTASS